MLADATKENKGRDIGVGQGWARLPEGFGVDDD